MAAMSGVMRRRSKSTWYLISCGASLDDAGKQAVNWPSASA
jgi:hypothetical protein